MSNFGYSPNKAHKSKSICFCSRHFSNFPTLTSYFAITLLGLLYLTFLHSHAHALPVIVFNDLEKELEGRVVEIDEVETTELKKIRYRLRIYPNQEKEIARGSVLRFSLSRVFPTHRLRYEVKCPDQGDVVRINILEIHENRISGGCTLSRHGHSSKRTGTKWVIVKNDGEQNKNQGINMIDKASGDEYQKEEDKGN
ncbi:MAG TPA: hypothetical protein PKA63_13330 [Oligoflexia bacterium]|nr:hypothetical protein [Oligoflexia bacterium]HMP49643.1 hypothetical protein [Oligoflexia bacterium]